MGLQLSGSKGRGQVLSEINVTPLVDVMLVLLIMFMVTAPLMQQGIDVDLPKTSSTGVEVTEDPFILVIEASGKISAANVSIPREQLGPKVKSIFVNRKNKQVYIQADRKTDYGIVAEVMADIKAAGISNIGLVTLPKD